MSKNNLEERLITFSILVIKISEQLPPSPAGRKLKEQIVNSSTSSALNYGEVQGAESPRDFIHKLKVVLKELRETFVNLRIIKGAQLLKDEIDLDVAIIENNELISIFVVSISTTRKNMRNKLLNDY